MNEPKGPMAEADAARVKTESEGNGAPRAHDHLRFFVAESNRIEGIRREPTDAELEAHYVFLAGEPTIEALEAFVAVCAPGKPLRRKVGQNVRVGSHYPIPGGKDVERGLLCILDMVDDEADPWDVHVAYETLHPFMDGNGRSGRALWLWQMVRQRYVDHAASMGFLHLFYYQTLQRSNHSVGGTEGATTPTPTPASTSRTDLEQAQASPTVCGEER